ncbi:restriction endonuclease subunit S [uncultured Microbacterium sp.]|uniref:restriction endonuclease subunit S n=1 Tax=uncultured Microbacterium sp. TaxID=191216 RepID=UPI00260750DE|nr:restriction endonuclease subunit S [uncultured Microbacterium sp.]
MTWETVRLGAIAQVVGGATPKTSEPAYWDGDIPWVTPAEISRLSGHYIESTERTISSDGLSRSGVQILPTGSVLLSSRAPIGLVAINRIPVGTNQGFKSLIPSDRIESNFLFWWLKSHTKLLQSKGRGATFLELSKAEVERIEIPLPPLPEQRRIAAILDEADALRAQLESARQRSRLLTDSLFNHIVEGAADFVPLGQVVTLITGPFGSSVHREDYVVGGVPLINPSHIVDGYIRSDVSVTVSGAKAEQLSAFSLQPGDVVLGRRGEMGRAAVVRPNDAPALCGTGTMVLRSPLTSQSGGLLARLLRTPRYVSELTAAASGVTMLNLSQSAVGGLLIPRPTAQLEAEVGVLDESTSAFIRDLDRRLHEANALFDSLQHRAFRGEL